MSNLWEKVELKEGEPVVYLGVYATRWQQDWGKPTVGFIQADNDALIADKERAEKMVERFQELAFTLIQGFRVDTFGTLPNGNVACGVDEGESRGNELIRELEQRYDTLITECKEQR